DLADHEVHEEGVNAGVVRHEATRTDLRSPAWSGAGARTHLGRARRPRPPGGRDQFVRRQCALGADDIVRYRAHRFLSDGLGAEGCGEQVAVRIPSGAMKGGDTTMRRKLIHAVLLALFVGLVCLLGTAEVASAHGERAQEGFLRMKTIAWQDVR